MLNNLEDRAKAAYFRHFGNTAAQPCGQADFHTVDDKEYVVLSNTRGLLACYRIRNNGFLRRVDNPPEAIACCY